MKRPDLARPARRPPRRRPESESESAWTQPQTAAQRTAHSEPAKPSLPLTGPRTPLAYSAATPSSDAEPGDAAARHTPPHRPTRRPPAARARFAGHRETAHLTPAHYGESFACMSAPLASVQGPQVAAVVTRPSPLPSFWPFPSPRTTPVPRGRPSPPLPDPDLNTRRAVKGLIWTLAPVLQEPLMEGASPVHPSQQPGLQDEDDTPVHNISPPPSADEAAAAAAGAAAASGNASPSNQMELEYANQVVRVDDCESCAPGPPGSRHVSRTRQDYSRAHRESY